MVHLVRVWRTRWRSLVLLTLLIAVAGGVAAAGVAGARRTGSSPERFHDAASSRDVFVNGVPADAGPLLEILDGPLVESYVEARFVFAFAEFEEFVYFFAPPTSEGIGIDQGILLEGRRPDPDEPLEVVVPEGVAQRYDLRPGDTWDGIVSLDPEQSAALLQGVDPSEPGGPALPLEITGVARTSGDLSARDDDPVGVLLSPAFLDTYAGQVGIGGSNYLVRLADGRAGLDEFTDAAEVAYGNTRELGLDVTDAEGVLAPSLDVISAALVVLAAVVAVVGFALAATAISRQQRSSSADDGVLRALGATPRSRTALLTASVLPAIVASAVLVPLLAIAASPVFPVGVGRRLEPAPGVDVDVPVLLVAAVAVLILTLLFAWVGAARIVRSARTAADARSGGRARFLDPIARALAPAPATGTRFALTTAPRVNAPVRPALAGACVGTLALVAVAVVGASLDQLVGDPARWGTTWDVAIETVEVDRDRVQDDDDVAAAALARFDEQVTVEDREVIAMTLDRVKGDLPPTTLEGRAPTSEEEVALGRETLDAIGADIGSTVEIESRSEPAKPYQVVGVVLFPTVDQSFPLTDGALFDVSGGDRLLLGDPERDDGGYLRLLVRWEPAVDHAEALDELAPGATINPPSPPPEVSGLRDVERFPAATGGVLALLGAAAVGHALSATTRRRRRELGILSALGFSPRQRATAVVTQATATGLVALGVGIPLGVAAGRFVWRAIADALGVATDPAVPWLSIAGGALGALAALHLLAIPPAIAARRIRPSHALRTE